MTKEQALEQIKEMTDRMVDSDTTISELIDIRMEVIDFVNELTTQGN